MFGIWVQSLQIQTELVRVDYRIDIPVDCCDLLSDRLFPHSWNSICNAGLMRTFIHRSRRTDNRNTKFFLPTPEYEIWHDGLTAQTKHSCHHV